MSIAPSDRGGCEALRATYAGDWRAGDNKSSGFRSLDDAAVAEARKWQFVPAMRGPKAAEARVEVPVRFELVE